VRILPTPTAIFNMIRYAVPDRLVTWTEVDNAEERFDRFGLVFRIRDQWHNGLKTVKTMTVSDGPGIACGGTVWFALFTVTPGREWIPRSEGFRWRCCPGILKRQRRDSGFLSVESSTVVAVEHWNWLSFRTASE